MKRVNNLFKKIISTENLELAIQEVNKSHHWRKNHQPNKCTAWVELTKNERIKDLRNIIINGFQPKQAHISTRWDASAQKIRQINEPIQWPDQYIHHALVQVLQPVMMRGMDYYCCGSIKGRGTARARESIQNWVRHDIKNTKYCLSLDIRHFYESIRPIVIMGRMKQLIKDHKILDLIWRVIKDGINIGFYTSQWFANTLLQPLDVLIHQDKNCKHYVRYMDNLTIFGSNKRKLHQLFGKIKSWLSEHGLSIKGDWQIFCCDKRMPQAVGYRFGRNFTLIRKRNLLRIKRAMRKYRRKGYATKEMAASLISRLGQLKYCNNYKIFKKIYWKFGIIKELKKTIRGKKSQLWRDYIEDMHLS